MLYIIFYIYLSRFYIGTSKIEGWDLIMLDKSAFPFVTSILISAF